MSAIELRDVGKSYGAREVLRGIHLSIEEGEFVSIVGCSASGKTTLVKLASGLMMPDRGSVIVNGEPVTDFSRQASIVFQNYSLLPWLTALENVRLAVESAFPEWTREKHIEQAREYLKKVGLGQAETKKPSQLSGGMRQRVAIARAFAVEPRVLFLDEPFGALDALTRATLQQELVRLASEPGRTLTTLMITNNVDEAILMSDRILALDRGPAASLSPAISVDLPKPRGTSVALNDARAVRIRAQLAEFLTSGRKARPATTLAHTAGPVKIAVQATQ